MKKLILMSLFALVTACSVEQKQSPNNPPKMPTGVLAFAQETGVLQVQEATLFFWPQGLTGDTLAKTVENVTVAGQVIEKYNLTPEKDRPPGFDKMYAQAVQVFFGILQPKGPSDFSNIQPVNAAATVLKIGTSQSQAVEGAWSGLPILPGGTYDPVDKTVQFVVPELTKEMKPTGRFYGFRLGRRMDPLGRVIFTGGVQFGPQNGPFRLGQVKITGAFVQAPPTK